jgi:DNA mismatch repair ATPase MutL
MKSMRVVSTAGIFLLLGTLAPVFAQRDGDKQGDSGKEEKGQPQRAQEPQQERQPQPQRAQQPQQQQQKQAQPQRAQQPQQQQQKQAQPQRAQQPQQQQQRQGSQPQQQQPQRAQQNYQPPAQRSQQQARSWQQQKGWAQQGAWQGHASWQQNRAQHWASDHRTWAQRGGYGGFYIPQASFGLYFGDQHFFRLHALPVMYMGYPRFEYGGYSFLLVDPWPEYWSDNWFDSDDLYIDYNDGYYLHDRRYPDVGLAVTIML